MSSDGFLLYALGCATAAYLAVQMLIHLYYALVVGDGIPRSRIELAAAAAGDAEADPSSTSYRGGHGEKHSYSLWRSIAAVAWRFPRDPTITGVIHCDVTQTVEVLERLKTEKGVRVTMTHLAAYGTAMAMKENPRANARVKFNRVVQSGDVDVFLQVALGGDNLSGIKVRNVDHKQPEDVAVAVHKKVTKLRAGKDKLFKKTFQSLRFVPNLLLGWFVELVAFLGNECSVNLPGHGIPRDPFGSAMITSLGMHGVDIGFAPFFPLARCPFILLVGSAQTRPWVVDDKVVPRKILNLCGSFDHRIIDGVLAAKISHVIKDSMQEWTERTEKALNDGTYEVPEAFLTNPIDEADKAAAAKETPRRAGMRNRKK